MRKGFGAGLLSIFIVSSLFVGGCNKRPEGVLSEDEMVSLLTDIELAEAYTMTTSQSNISRDVLMESVLAKHGVTHAQLDSTIAYYGKNMDEYYKLYEKVEKNLRAQNGEGQDAYDEKNDIWPYPRFTAILPNQTSDGITFSMPAEGLSAGSSLEWRMRLTSADGANAVLGVEYDNGMSSLSKKNGSGLTNFQIELQTDTALKVKRIFGYLTLPQDGMPVWADSIRLVKADYDSVTYHKIRSQKRLFQPKQAPPKLKVETDSVAEED